MSRIRQRAEALLTLACGDVQDRNVEAKAAHEAAPTAETQAAKRQAMAALAETRAWLRAKDTLDRMPGQIAGLQVQLANVQEESTRKKLQARLSAYEAKLVRVERDYGPLVAEMDAFAAGGA